MAFMSFASGTISFRRFAVVGEQTESIDQALLDKLSEHALRPGVGGGTEEIEYGWSGGRHVLDGTFSFENNVFSEAVHFALRVDVNKVPGELKKAYTLMEEDALAAGNPSGFISKLQKRDAKDSVRQKIDDELRSGKFRRSRLLLVLWDVPGRTLYCTASGKQLEMLMELFERTFNLSLHPLSAGALGLRLLEPRGRRRDYEDLRPTRFVYGPAGESEHPEYPWVLKGAEPKDFLGNEFLLWLWHEAERSNGTVKTESSGAVSLLIDKSLDLDCAYGQTGRDTLRGDGPARMPEARDAIRVGKLPRRAGIVLDASNQQFAFTFNPETFACNATRLPEVEDAQTPRVLFEERIALLREFARILDDLFAAFLKVRAGSAWEGQAGEVRRWIGGFQKAVAAVA
jgi:hypothetical protein